ncbi:hypothetical protein EON81_00080 [bacterium]|nr:MAG: hypothetical protein EON81_00080 [bacterium]
MRTIATAALSLLFALGFSQAPTFSRITLDPTITVPSGDVFCLDIAPIGGYSLVLSNAGNLSRDSAFGTQYYLVNPEGDAERIPFEKVGAMSRQIKDAYTYLESSRISPRGSAAIIRASDGQYYFYKREGKTFKKIPGIQGAIGFISETRAIVRRRAGPISNGGTDLAGWTETLWYDAEQGTLTPLNLPTSAPVVSLDRLLGGGRKLAYFSETDQRYHLFDVFSKADVSTQIPQLTTRAIFDDTGTYLYRINTEGSDAVLDRISLATGNVETLHRYVGTPAIYVDAAYGDKVLLLTPHELDSAEVELGWDVYQYDVETEQTALVSRKPDGNPSNNLLNSLDQTRYTPDGNEILYRTETNTIYAYENRPPLPGEWRYAFRYPYRHAVGQPRQLVARAATGGGANARALVVSRNQSAVLYAAANPGIEGWARLIVRDSSARLEGRVVSNSDPYAQTPCDVSDDGRFTVYNGYSQTGGSDEGYHLFVNDSQTGLTRRVTGEFTNGIRTIKGKVDQEGNMFFIANTTGRYAGLSGFWLFRYDMVSGTLTPLRSIGEGPLNPDLVVGGGRVAHMVGTTASPTVAVTDGFSGQERFRVAVPTTVNPASMTLTTDRKTLALSDGGQTMLYDIPSGALRKTFPLGGFLLPSGQWILAYEKVMNVASGAIYPYNAQTVGLGAPVGPITMAGEVNGGSFNSSPFGVNNDRGADYWRYRISIPASPVLYDTSLELYQGYVEIRTKYLPAGLEAAETWIEARINGGDWEKITLIENANFARIPSRNGPFVVDLRVRDALGRTSEIQSRSLVGDRVNPLVSGVTATVSGTEATIRYTKNEAGTSQVRFGTASLSSKVDGGYKAAGEVEIKLTGLTPNTTYKYIVDAGDSVGNIGRSEQLTFTTGP